jgi:hypothetical protein
MGGKRATDSFKPYSEALSGSIKSFKEPAWTHSRQLRRSFVLGDLVTLAPEYYERKREWELEDIDIERYIGIVTEAYSNYEYMVVWTSKPRYMAFSAMYNGDHLIKVEYADVAYVTRK